MTTEKKSVSLVGIAVKAVVWMYFLMTMIAFFFAVFAGVVKWIFYILNDPREPGTPPGLKERFISLLAVLAWSAAMNIGWWLISKEKGRGWAHSIVAAESEARLNGFFIVLLGAAIVSGFIIGMLLPLF